MKQVLFNTGKILLKYIDDKRNYLPLFVATFYQFAD